MGKKSKIIEIKNYKDRDYISICGNYYYLDEYCKGEIGLISISPEIAYTLKILEDNRVLVSDVYEDQPSSKVGRKINSSKSKQGATNQEQRELIAMQPDISAAMAKAREFGYSNQCGRYWWDKEHRDESLRKYREETYPKRKQNPSFQERYIRRCFRNGRRLVSGEIKPMTDYREVLTNPSYDKGAKVEE